MGHGFLKNTLSVFNFGQFLGGLWGGGFGGFPSVLLWIGFLLSLSQSNATTKRKLKKLKKLF